MTKSELYLLISTVVICLVFILGICAWSIKTTKRIDTFQEDLELRLDKSCPSSEYNPTFKEQQWACVKYHEALYEPFMYEKDRDLYEPIYKEMLDNLGCRAILTNTD